MTGSKNTAVMIMNPNTGEILAEASYPNFDLNKPRDLSSIYSEEKWNAIDEKDQLKILSSIWRNFCVSDAFEPGSTMKPFTVAAGLETGTLTGEESYYCGGYLHVGDNDIGCHLRSGHGTESTMDAIANSCNVALMEMAEKSELIILSDTSIFLALENIRELTFRQKHQQQVFCIQLIR